MFLVRLFYCFIFFPNFFVKKLLFFQNVETSIGILLFFQNLKQVYFQPVSNHSNFGYCKEVKNNKSKVFPLHRYLLSSSLLHENLFHQVFLCKFLILKILFQPTFVLWNSCGKILVASLSNVQKWIWSKNIMSSINLINSKINVRI